MQDVQVPRYPPHKGESDLFHGLRVLWVQAIRLCYQDGFPSAGWSEKKGSSVMIIFPVSLLARCHGMPDRLRLPDSLSSAVQSIALRGGILILFVRMGEARPGSLQPQHSSV